MTDATHSSKPLAASAAAVEAIMSELGCSSTQIVTAACAIHPGAGWTSRGCALVSRLADELWSHARAEPLEALLEALLEAVEVGEDLLRYEPILGHKFGYPGDLGRLRAIATGNAPVLPCDADCIDCARYAQTFDPPMPPAIDGDVIRFDATLSEDRAHPELVRWSWSCTCGEGSDPALWRELDWRAHVAEISRTDTGGSGTDALQTMPA